MNEVLTFTEAALAYVQDMVVKNKSLGFRVSVKKTGCSGFSYAPSLISEAVSGDLQFQIKEAFMLYVDPACYELVKGLTVDYVEEKKDGLLKQKKLIFINPNEKSRCGCGESFHV
jgi:iron-sulfur cluster assembly protein